MLSLCCRTSDTGQEKEVKLLQEIIVRELCNKMSNISVELRFLLTMLCYDKYLYFLVSFSTRQASCSAVYYINGHDNGRTRLN